MSLFDPPEECPHCDEPQPSEQMDAHVAAAHADLPPCRAFIETEYRETYRCAFRAGHAKGKYGEWHASTSEASPGRYVWNDSATGATPHRSPEPFGSLDCPQLLRGTAHDAHEHKGRHCHGVSLTSDSEGHPEPPSEGALNDALPVRPDPRQPAYDAVYEYIRKLGGYLPPDPVHRNAVIWRAVNAALGATPVGRCASSHCVEGDHIVPVDGEWEAP
jgi:hypothetical protein